MEEVKLPTVGRTVHFFPNGDQLTGHNNAEVLPALVIQAFGQNLNLQVFTMNPDAPNVLRYSTAHKSSISKNEAGEINKGQSYWEWPEIK